MNKILIAAALAAPVAMGAGTYGAYQLGANSQAQPENLLPEGYARVLNVEPQTRTVAVRTPRKECRTVPVQKNVKKDKNIVTGTAGQTVIGGAIGALVGNQIGDGRGKDAATVAGGLAGAAYGAKRANRNEYKTVTVNETRCKTVHDTHNETRPDGYKVTYEYQGEIHTTTLDYNPGPNVRVERELKVIKDS